MDGISSAVDTWHLEEAPVGPSPRSGLFEAAAGAVDSTMPWLWVSPPTAATWSHSLTLCTVARLCRVLSLGKPFSLLEERIRSACQRAPGDTALDRIGVGVHRPLAPFHQEGVPSFLPVV